MKIFGNSGTEDKKDMPESGNTKLLRIDSNENAKFFKANKYKDSLKIANGETYILDPKEDTFFWMMGYKYLFFPVWYKIYVAVKGFEKVVSWRNIFSKNPALKSKISTKEISAFIDMQILNDLLSAKIGVEKKDVIIYLILGAVGGYFAQDILAGFI